VKENKPDFTIKRILVALDASSHSLAALKAAAELAASLHAELIGLFVEDENLLHLAGLPFAHEVRSPSATSEPIDSDKMEQDLHLQASQARYALEEAAARVNARWTFKVVRGQVTSAVLAEALKADLLAMGRVSRPLMRKSRLGSTARAASAGTKRSVLLMPHSGGLNYPVLVTYDGSKAAKQALMAATRLAQASRDMLNVLLLYEAEAEAESLQKEVSEWLEDRGLTADYHGLPEATVSELARLVEAAENCVLVLGGEDQLMRAESIQELLDRTDCPVMLVR
jgi:nucleotide-binding universal stress UspA family protein